MDIEVEESHDTLFLTKLMPYWKVIHTIVNTQVIKSMKGVQRVKPCKE